MAFLWFGKNKEVKKKVKSKTLKRKPITRKTTKKTIQKKEISKKTITKTATKKKLIQKKTTKRKPLKTTKPKRTSQKVKITISASEKKRKENKEATKQLKELKKNLIKKKKIDDLNKAIIKKEKKEALKKINQKLKKKNSKIKKGTKISKEPKVMADGVELNGEVIKKIKLGIKGFDDLFREGIPEGAAVLIEGGPGSGKTILTLQMAYNACKQGKRVLYMTFEEPVRRLIGHMKSFGWDPKPYIKSGHLVIKKFNSLDVARSVEALLSEAKKELLIDIQPVLIPTESKPELVCIDSLSSIASAFSGEEARFRIYMEQLFKYLESNNITSLLIRETSNPTHTGNTFSEKGEAISFLSDGIIVVYNVIYNNGKRARAIEILKMRGEDIDRRIVQGIIINKKGWVIFPKKELGEKIGYKLT